MRKLLSVILSILILASGCIYLPGGSLTGGQQPIINSFGANPATIQPGGSSTLSWSVTGASTVTIDNGIGNVALSGTRAIAPVSNTTYVLTASNTAGSATATTQVIVSGSGTPAGSGVPVISSFSASPNTISPGASSTLNWDIFNATSVTIDQGVGSVTTTGSRTVTPGISTIYTITATNSSGSVTAQAQVTVAGAGPPSVSFPIINSFAASPGTVISGGSTTLSWSVSGANQVSISGIGSVNAVGSQTVAPTSTATYTLLASNSTGIVTKTITVSVLPFIPLAITVFDFVARAPFAHWMSNVNLPFGGPDTDNRGFALLRNNVTLEDNNVYTQVLETHPQWVTGGIIQGAYTEMFSSYQVQASDRFRSQIGFIKGANAGNVRFRVMIRTESGNTWIVEVVKPYTGSLSTIDFPLSAYAGSKADFILEVDANNPNAAQDWAVWVNARITR